MMPVAFALMLGAAVLAGAAVALLVVRSKRRRPLRSNIVDLAAARRRKLREAAGKPASEEAAKRKRPLAPNGAEIRKFVPKIGEGRQYSCSRCQKKSDSVDFYLNDYGQRVGVCKECRKSAKNRDLMPL